MRILGRPPSCLRSIVRTAAQRRGRGRQAISPRIVEALEDLDVMIEFVDWTTMSAEELRAPEKARRIADSLRRLHAGPRFRQDFDMFRQGSTSASAQARVPSPTGSVVSARRRTDRAGAVRSAAPTVPCHNDLLAENYIDDGSQLWIVDFEYSGNNDPTFELGDTAQECAFDSDQRARLCEAYFGESARALSRG